MSRPVVRVDPETPVTEAAGVLVEHGFSALPVVEGGRLVAIVTEADLVRVRIPVGDADAPAARRAMTTGEVMTPDPLTRTSDSDWPTSSARCSTGSSGRSRWSTTGRSSASSPVATCSGASPRGG